MFVVCVELHIKTIIVAIALAYSIANIGNYDSIYTLWLYTTFCSLFGIESQKKFHKCTLELQCDCAVIKFVTIECVYRVYYTRLFA